MTVPTLELLYFMFQLDTEEFQLPPVDALPTLESILGEDDQGNTASPANSGSAHHHVSTG